MTGVVAAYAFIGMEFGAGQLAYGLRFGVKQKNGLTVRGYFEIRFKLRAFAYVAPRGKHHEVLSGGERYVGKTPFGGVFRVVREGVAAKIDGFTARVMYLQPVGKVAVGLL